MGSLKGFYDSFKKTRGFPLAVGILCLVFGILCLLNPSVSMESMALFAGILFLALGLLMFLNGLRIRDNRTLRILYMVLGGVIAVLAVLVFANLSLIGKYLPVLAGFFMILSAVSTLLPALSLLKNGAKNWWYSALPAALLLVLGLIFLLSPGFVGQTFGIFSGIALLINGLSNLIAFAQYRKLLLPQ